MNKNLNELCTINIGGPQKRNIKGKYRIFYSNPAIKEYCDNYNAIENTIIINTFGIYKGYVHKLDKKMWISSLFYYLTDIKTEIISEEYLYYYMKFNNENVLNKIKNNTMTKIKIENIIENINVYIPSIEIQKQIITKCTEIDNNNKILDKKIRKTVKELGGKIEENKKLAEKIMNELFDPMNQDEVDSIVDNLQKEMIIYI